MTIETTTNLSLLYETDAGYVGNRVFAHNMKLIDDLVVGGGLVPHELASGTGLGAYHTISGAATGQVLRALSATTAAFDQLGFSDLGGTLSSAQHGTIATGDLHPEYLSSAGGIITGDVNVTGTVSAYTVKDYQRVFSTEFGETSGVPPSQAWFDAMKANGFDGIAVPLHNLAQTASNPHADTVITRAEVAGLWVCGYYRPVEDTRDGYGDLSDASKALVRFMVFDIEDVGHTSSVDEVLSFEADYGKGAWVYTNWGLFGDVMGYGLTGWSRLKLWMRDIYTAPSTPDEAAPFLEEPVDLYTAVAGKSFESYDNDPPHWPADWTWRDGVQWADPGNFTFGAEAYDCTVNLMDSAACGFFADYSPKHHEHGADGDGGNRFSAPTSDFRGNISIYYTETSKALLFGTVDALHSADTEGLDIHYDLDDEEAVFEAARYDDDYRPFRFRGKRMKWAIGSTGISEDLILDEAGRLSLHYTSGARGIYLGTMDSMHTGETEGLEISFDFTTGRSLIETAWYGHDYLGLTVVAKDILFNAGSGGASQVLKLDASGPAFRAEGQTTHMLLTKAADAGNRTAVFQDLDGTVAYLGDIAAHVASSHTGGATPAPHVLATGTALGAEHTMSGAAAGEVLRALSATTAAFDQLDFSDLAGTLTAAQHGSLTGDLHPGYTDATEFAAHTTGAPDAHHNQAHVLATGTALGGDHTISGATAGEVLRALSATTAAFDQLNFTDLAGSISSAQHPSIASGNLHPEYHTSAEVATDIATHAAIASSHHSSTSNALAITPASVVTTGAVTVGNLTANRVVLSGTGGLLGSLAAGTSGQFLQSNGAGVDPTWVTGSVSSHDINGASHTGFPLTLTNGGTSKALTAINGGIVWSDADSLEIAAAGASGQLLQSAGAAAPTWITSINSTQHGVIGGTTQHPDYATLTHLGIHAQIVEAHGTDANILVRVATAAVLPGTPTYANGTAGVGATLTAAAAGTLTIDGVLIKQGDHILVKDQASGLQNGIYTCTTEGVIVDAAYVLTRSVAYDESVDIFGARVFVSVGTTNAGTSWVNTNGSAPTMGTTAITFGSWVFSSTQHGSIASGNLHPEYATDTDLSTHAALATHHTQAHVLATGTALGADHTISGAVAGEVLRALSATTAAFDVLQYSDLGGVPSTFAPTTHDINGASHSTFPLTLTNGGTGASLTASNGGIVWTNATTMAVLAGTATANKMLLSGATATPAWSTSTIPTSAGATAGKVLLSDGTNYVLSTPTFPNASATAGKFIRSDGTNWIASTPTLPTTAGTASKWLRSDGTNYVESTATLPPTATGTGTILRADGTNWAATTATYPTTTTINRILYSSSADVIGQITTANSGVLVTSSGGVPSIATDIPTAVTIGGAAIYRAGGTDVAVADGGTGLSTLGGTNRLLYTTTTDNISSITTANSSILVTSAGGVPSWATDIPTAVTIGGAAIYRVGGTDVALADGGTGASLTVVPGAVAYSTGSAIAFTGVGSTGQFLQSNAAGAPTWVTGSVSSHELANGTSLGANHTISGATAGEVLRALSATTAAFDQLNFSDLAGSISSGQHPVIASGDLHTEYVLAAGDTMTGTLQITQSNGGIEIGAQGSSNTPLIDFHSGATNVDYDARIIASGGTGSTGGGALTIRADAGITLSGTTGITMNAAIVTTLGLTNGSAEFGTPSGVPGIVLRADSATQMRADIRRSTTALDIGVHDTNGIPAAALQIFNGATGPTPGAVQINNSGTAALGVVGDIIVGVGLAAVNKNIRITDTGGNADRVLVRDNANNMYVGDVDANAGDLHLRANGVTVIRVRDVSGTQYIGFYGVTPVGRAAGPAAAPAGLTGTAAGGWSTAANRDAAITTINTMRTILINLGLMS